MKRGCPIRETPFVIEVMKKGRKGAKTRTSIKHDGSVVDNFTSEYRNPHVSQESRDFIKKAVPQTIENARIFSGHYDRKPYVTAGATIRDEIASRVKARKKAKDPECDGKPQVEDIYDVLRDVRDFGKPDDFDRISFESEISDERTQAILKEAFDRFPTDWYKGIDVDGECRIFIHDGPGRADFTHGGYGGYTTIHLFARENPITVKDLGLENDELPDRAIVNQLVHELGHYMEHYNSTVRITAQQCLEDRTAKSESTYLEPGYETKADSFFSSYMGKQYYDGSTEITSVLMQHLGYGNPFDDMTGKEFWSDNKDRESLKYILGVLGGC